MRTLGSMDLDPAPVTSVTPRFLQPICWICRISNAPQPEGRRLRKTVVGLTTGSLATAPGKHAPLLLGPASDRQRVIQIHLVVLFPCRDGGFFAGEGLLALDLGGVGAAGDGFFQQADFVEHF